MASILEQEKRPLIFILFPTTSAGLIGFAPIISILGKPGTVHPEAYSYRRPSRGTLINTMDSAFIDTFGEGVGQITIEGQTGWKQGDYGLAQFKVLETMFTEYHRRRDAIRDSGGLLDPNAIQLWLIDTLNLEASSVYPQEFYLIRSRQRPLLYQYRIQLLVVTDLLQSAINAIGGVISQAVAVVGPSAGTIANVEQDLQGIGNSLGSLLSGFVS